MKLNNIKLFSMFAVLFMVVFASCEDESSTEDLIGSQNYVSFENNKSVLVGTGETSVIDVTIYASQASSSDRTLQLEVAPTSTASPDVYSMPTSVTIPAGEKQVTFPVSIEGSGLGSAGKTIIIGIVAQEGVNVASTYSGSQTLGTYAVTSKRITITAKEGCTANPLRIQIVTDQYGSETTWELYNNSDMVNPIAEGGPYTDAAANGAYPQPNVDLCLESGTYTFVIYDVYSDGMDSGYGAGFYRLVHMNEDFTVEGAEIAKNGVFGAFDTVEFIMP